MLTTILNFITGSGTGLIVFSIFGMTFCYTALKTLNKIEKKLGIR